MKGKMSESIFSGKNTTIPMADVQHIEKQFYNMNLENPVCKKGGLQGIVIITKHTRWDVEVGTWANNAYIGNIDGEAERFIKAWCFYRHEIEGGDEAFISPEDKP